MVNLVNLNQTSYTQSLTAYTQKNTSQDAQSTTSVLNASVSIQELSLTAAEYIPSDPTADPKKAGTYTVDLEKVKAMKDETDQRMLELFKDTARGTGLKQLGGIRGILDKLAQGEKVTLEIEYTAADVEKAKADVAEGGYWSAEETSNRLLDFAKAISGGDKSKASMLQDSFQKAFKEIEDMFGGKLPDLSYDTYNKTIDKFKQWSEEQ